MDSVRKKSTRSKVIDSHKKRAEARRKRIDKFKKKCSDSWASITYTWWDKTFYVSLIAYILLSSFILGSYLFNDQVTIFSEIWTYLDGIIFWGIICTPFIAFLFAFTKIRRSLQGEDVWTKIDVRRGFSYAYATEFTAEKFLPGFVYKFLLIPIIAYAISMWLGWITLSDFTRNDWYKWFVLVLLNTLALVIALYDIKLREMLHAYFKEWVKTNHIAALNQFESSLIANFYEKCGGGRETIALAILKVSKGDNATKKVWLGKEFYDHTRMSVTLFYKKVSFDTLEETSSIALNVEKHLQTYYLSNDWKAKENNEGSGHTDKTDSPFKHLIGEVYFVGGLPESFTHRQITCGSFSWDKDRTKSFDEQLNYKKIYYQSIESINYCNNSLEIQAQGSAVKIPLYAKDAGGNQKLTKQIYDIIQPQKSRHECYT